MITRDRIAILTSMTLAASGLHLHPIGHQVTTNDGHLHLDMNRRLAAFCLAPSARAHFLGFIQARRAFLLEATLAAVEAAAVDIRTHANYR